MQNKLNVGFYSFTTTFTGVYDNIKAGHSTACGCESANL
jgi:hypothetical protein